MKSEKSIKSKTVQQLELPFPKSQRTTRRIKANVRYGKLPSIITLHDIDKIIGPHGDAARDSFDHDVSMFQNDFDERY
jgi:hypothetical protein